MKWGRWPGQSSLGEEAEIKRTPPLCRPQQSRHGLNRENCHLGRDENEQKKEKISFRSDSGMKNAVGKSGKGGQGLALQRTHVRTRAQLLGVTASWQLVAVLCSGKRGTSPPVCSRAPREPATLRAATPGTRAGCGPSLIRRLGAAGPASALGLAP